MTVVNYSVQETFGNNVFFWQGLDWFEQLLRSELFHAALGRQFMFTFLILAIEVPLGIIIALSMPREGFWVPICLVTMALPMLIPWNVVGAMWNIFTLPDIGLLGYLMNHILGIPYDMTQNPFAAWVTIITMDVWHWNSLVVLLSYAGLRLIPDAYYQAAKIDGASAGAQDNLSTQCAQNAASEIGVHSSSHSASRRRGIYISGDPTPRRLESRPSHAVDCRQS